MKNIINDNSERLPQSLFRLLAICLFLSCLFVRGLLADWPPLPSCPNTITGNCDDVEFHDTVAANCYRFRIVNVGKSSPLSRFAIIAGSDVTTQWVCSVTIDTNDISQNFTTANAYHGPMLQSRWSKISTPGDAFQQVYSDNTGFGGSLRHRTGPARCDSGFITICFCCIHNSTTINFPLTIRTYHADPLNPLIIIDSCDKSFIIPIHPGDCDGSLWDCDSNCDQLAIDGPTKDPITKEWKFCATIKQLSAGELRNFTLHFNCASSSPGSVMRPWRLEGMPYGWYNSSLNPDSATFVDTTSTNSPAAANCSSSTFCFVSDTCDANADLCDTISVSLTTPDQLANCNVSQKLIFTKPNTPPTDPPLPDKDDQGCCGGHVIGVNTPTQDPIYGIWTTCVEVHMTGTTSSDTLTNLTICHTNERCIQLDDVANGWTLVSSSTIGPNTCDVFKRTTVPNLGCRTFEFCYVTCDCQQTSTSPGIIWTISGDNITTTVIPVNIPADGGNCCGSDHRWIRDDVQVTWSSGEPQCLTYTLLNSHDPCSVLNDFHFTVPSPCNASSITITPSGFISSVIGNQINITTITGAQIDCCSTMVVKVCFDSCIGPFPPFVTHWQSTHNGTPVTDSTQSVDPGLIMHPLIAKSVAGSKPSIPNYPNPFGAPDFRTTIPFETDGTGIAQIMVTDASGKIVLDDDIEIADAGKHFFYFTAKELPAGTYYYRIQFPKGKRIIVNREMILVK